MKGFVALFVLLYAFEVQSQNCKDVADKWTYYNDVSDEDGEMFRFEDAGSVKKLTFDFEYLYYIMEDDATLVILKQHMTEYEEETPSHQNSQTADVDVTFTCEDDVEILKHVQLGIRDSNNHDPEFVSADKTKIPTYEYLLPMPTPAKIPLAIFGDTIWARDIELSNTRMNFDIDPAGLTATLGIADLVGKMYEAVVTTDSVLDFEEKTFTITATDFDETNDPRRTTTATIIIRRDESTSVITPVFSEHYYTGIYYPEGETVVAIDRPITVSKAERVEIVESEYEAYFQVTLIDETVSITSKALIENDELDVIVFSLEASRDDGNKPGYTTVSLQYQRNPIQILHFEKTLYSGKMEDGHLNLEPIQLINTDNTQATIIVSVEFQYRKYFDITVEGSIVILTPKSAIDVDKLDEAAFSIYANQEDVEASTVIALKIIRDEQVLQFEKILYTNTFDVEKPEEKLEMTLINVENDEVPIQVSMEGENNQYFDIGVSGNVVTLSAKVGLKEATITNAAFTIKAIQEEIGEAYTTVAVEIIRPVLKELQFEESLYTSVFDVEKTGNVIVMKLLNVDAVVNVNVEIEDDDDQYGPYFTVTASDGVVTLSATDKLKDADFTGVAFTVKASQAGNGETLTVVALEITHPAPEVLQFEKILYTNTFDVEKPEEKLEMTLINVENDEVPIQVSMEGENNQYFDIGVSGNVVTLSAKVGLKEATITNAAFTIKAIQEEIGEAYTTVALEIIRPVLKELQFEESLYTSVFDVEKTGNVIVMKLLNVDAEVNVNVEIEDDDDQYGPYFTVTASDGVVTLSATDKLKDADFTSVAFTVKASQAGNGETLTVVALEITHPAPEDTSLQFEEILYTGILDMDKNDDKIELTLINVVDGVEVQVIIEGDNDQYFNIMESAGLVTISAKEALKEAVITKAAFTVKASQKDIGEAVTVVAVEIIRQPPEDSPLQFKEILYMGAFNVEQPDDKIEMILLNIADGEGVQVIIEGDNDKYFRVRENEGIVTLSAKDELQDAKFFEAAFTVKASQVGIGEAFTAVAVEIIRPTVEVQQPKFGQTLYSGTCDADKLEVSLPVIKVTNAVNVDVQPEYQIYFTASLADDGVITIAVQKEINSFGYDNVAFTLTAANIEGDTSEAVVHLDIIDQEPTVPSPKFEQTVYRGNCDAESLTIDMENIIVLNPENADIKLEDGYDKYFDVKLLESGLVTIDALPSIQEENFPYTAFSIEVSNDNSDPDTTFVQLEIIRENGNPNAPAFDKNLYRGELDAETLSLTLEPIRLTNPERVDIMLETGYELYFTVRLESDGIVIIEALEPIKHEAFTSITFSILASISDLIYDSSVIQLEIKSSTVPPSPLPKFENDIYRGICDAQTLGVSIEDIVVKNPENAALKIENGYDIFFSANLLSSGKVDIIALPSLQQEAFSSAVFTLEVYRGSNNPDTTVIYLDIDRANIDPIPSPTFEQTVYRGNCDAESLAIDMENIIVLNPENAAIKLEDGYDKYFDVKLLESGLVTIDALPSIQEENFPYTAFSIEVSNDNSDPDTTFVQLEIIRENGNPNAPAFDKNLYRGELDAETLSLTLEPIRLTNPERADIMLETGYELYFTVRLESDGIVIIEALEPIKHEAFTSITFSISASISDLIYDSSVIQLEIKRSTVPPSPLPKFENEIYRGICDAQTLGVSIEDIVVKNSENAALKIENGYDIFFSANLLSTGKVDIIALPSLQQEEFSSAVFTLEVYRGSNNPDTTVIYLDIDRANIDPNLPAKFEEAVYRGSCDANSLDIILEDIIVINPENAAIKLEDGYDQYFEVKLLESGQVTIDALPSIKEESFPYAAFSLEVSNGIGDPDTTFVQLEIIRENGNPNPPTFEKHLYRGQLDAEILHLTLEPIRLTNPERADIVLETGYELYFTVTLENNGNVIIEALEPIKHEAFTSITFSILASVSDMVYDSTVIQLEIQRSTVVPNPLPKFDNAIYRGNCDAQTLDITIEDIIVTNPENAALKIENGYEIFFSADLSSDGKVDITALPSLQQEDFLSAVFTLEVYRGSNNPDTTVIYLDINRKDVDPNSPHFVHDLYRGNLIAESLEISFHDEPIKLLNYEDTNIKVEEGYELYFTATLTNGEVVVTALDAIQDEDFTSITFRILALKGTTELDSTVVQLDIERGNITPDPLPKFEETVYRGTCDPATQEIDLNVPIKVLNYENANIEVEYGYETYFEPTLSNGEVTLTALPAILNEDFTYAAFSLKVSRGNNAPDTTFVQLDIIRDTVDPDLPKFEDHLYKGILDADNLILNIPAVKLSNYELADVRLETGYDLYFTVSLEDDGEVKIVPKPSIQREEFTSMTFSLIASVDSKDHDSTVVQLDIQRTVLTPDPLPEFEYKVYRGSCNADTRDVTIDVINVLNYENAIIKIEDGYEQYFEVQLLITGQVQISAKHTVRDIQFAAFTLEVSRGPNNPDSTFIQMEIIGNNGDPNSPRFENNIYRGTLDAETLTVTLPTAVKLLNSQDASVRVETGYELYFDVLLQDNGIVTIAALPTIKNEEFMSITFSITATLENVDQDSTVIQLEIERPSIKPRPQPKFARGIYRGSCDIETLEITIDDIIVLNPENAVVNVERGFETIFKAEMNAFGVVTLTAIESLKDKQFDYTTFTLEVSRGINAKDSTAIQLDIIRGDEVLAPKWEKSLYEGKCDAESLEVTISEIKVEQAERVQVQSEYNEFFSARLENGVVEISALQPVKIATWSNVAFTVTALRTGADSVDTVIHLEIIRDNTPILPPKWEKPLYEGKCDAESLEVTISEIKVEQAERVQVQSEYNEFFSARLENGVVEISALQPVKIATWSDVAFTVTALRTGADSVDTVIHLEIIRDNTPILPPKWEKPLYEGKCDAESLEVTISEIKVEQAERVQVQSEYNEFFSARLENGVVEISALQPVKIATWSDIAFTVTALRTGADSVDTVIHLEIIRDNTPILPPKWEKPLYEGNCDAESLEVTISEIRVEQAEDVQVQSEYNEFFSARLENGVVEISALQPVKTATWSDIAFTVTASRTGADSVDTVIHLEIIRDFTSIPGAKWEKPLYEGECDVDTLTVAISEEMKVTNAEGVKVDPEYEQFFNAELVNGIVEITALDPVKSAPWTDVAFIVSASSGAASVDTVVHLEIKQDSTPTPAPKWEKSLYGGECDAESLVVILEEIKVTNAVDVKVQPEYDVYFDAELMNGVVKIIALNPVKQAPWNDVAFIVSASGSASVDTVIHLEIKRDSKPSVTLAPSPSEFKIDPPDSKDMEIYQFSATSTHPTDSIRFSLINPDNLPVFIHQQTGILSLTNAIISGRHAVTVVAEGTESGESDRRQISLVVSAAVICPNGEVNVLFSYLTKYATETEQTTILDRTDVSDSASSDLRYCINEVIPDDKGIFEITEDRDGNQILVATKELLREGNSVIGMDVPQYTLTVSVKKENCDTPNSFVNMVGGIYLPESIQNQPDTITITVLIDDVNNHEPEFDQDSIIICYPKKELAKTIRPQYLTKVHATDEDATTGKGYGIVHYTTTSENIYIDELSGIIYPTESIYENNIAEATISAQDGGGKSASQDMKLTIKLIEENKISVLSLRNVPLDELDETLEKLSASAQVDIRSLSASAVPFENSNRRAATDYYLDVYVYGIKNEEPVTTSELQSALEGVDIVSVNKFNAPSSNDDDSVTGYIVAVSLLSVLLFLVIVGGIAFWYFKLRDPYSNFDPYEEHITKTSIDTPPPSETFTHPRRATGYVFNDTDETKKDEDDIDGYESVRSAKSVDTSASPDDKERRKSVSFIPYIEKIQIEKTEDGEDEDEETTKV